ncbi:nudC domain-containing protein 3 [Dermacentor albipictus]|uniref:nudC domain-containing protein 3 n=1 Tax=Dermacentor albipictus TaxID=60249 RepID=UPI0031FCC9B3
MDASRRGIYDAALMGILSNEGQIYPFLDAIFDFLYRRTDFYRIKSSPSDKLGFSPGVARRIVRAAFESYNKLANEAQKKAGPAAPVITQPEELLQIATEVEVETTTSDDTLESTTSESVAAEPVETVATAAKSKSQCSQKGDAGNIEPTENGKADGPSISAPKAGDENGDPDYDPVQAKFQSHPESYNGAIRDNYCWSQSIRDLDVRVKVGSDVTSRNQVRVTIHPNHLKVELLDLVTKTWAVHVDDDLHSRIKLDESIWTLVPGDHVLVNLEKATELWWDRLLVNEPKINIRAIDPTKPFEDLDPESQAKIQELTYNNLLKQAGRKTPQEEKVENLLREAWDKDGSPFKGQPFDPSIVNLSGCNGNI